MNARTKMLGGGLGVASVVLVGFLSMTGALVDSGKDTLASLLTTCTEGQQPRKVSGVWACADGGAVAGGDITAVTTSASSGLSGGCTSGACAITMLSTCNVGERLEWSGTAWVCRVLNDYRGTHFEYSDDWVSGGSVEPWQGTAAGTGALVTTAAAFGRLGIEDFQTGTTAVGWSRAVSSNLALDLTAYPRILHEVTAGWPTLSDSSQGYSSAIGFIDAVTVDQVDGCYFLYDERNSAAGNWNPTNLHKPACVCSSNSSRTGYLLNGQTSDSGFATVDTTIAALDTSTNTNWHTFRVDVAGTVPRADFYIDGTKVCVISTAASIPGGVGRTTGIGLIILKSVGTTSRSLYVDRTKFAGDFAAARTP